MKEIIVLPGRTETQYVTRNVHEHRAPTDESVKLLREMEEKIEKSRVAALRISDNKVNCHINFYKDCLDFQSRAHAVFDVNGKRCTATTTTEGFCDNPSEMLLKLRDAIATEIATKIMTDFLEKEPHVFR